MCKKEIMWVLCSVILWYKSEKSTKRYSKHWCSDITQIQWNKKAKKIYGENKRGYANLS